MRFQASVLVALLLGAPAWAHAEQSTVEQRGSRLASGGAGREHPVRCERPAPGIRADPVRLERAIRDASLRFGLDPALIWAVIRAESSGDPRALSHRGAMGLMQLMPATALGLGVSCPYDVHENVTGGARYLRRLRDELGSWQRALAGYNAGPTRVRKDQIPSITHRYVERVMEDWLSAD